MRLADDWFDRELPGNVAVGDGSWLHSTYSCLHYRSERGVRIGEHSGIYVGTYFDLGPDGEVEIGDHATVVGAIISTNSRVTIGDYAFVSHEVVIADGPFAAPPGERPRGPRADVTIGTNAWIGVRAVVLGGATIGDDAIVGAGAVVDFPVPSGAIVAGTPARVVGRV